jgi:hypothetical protein
LNNDKEKKAAAATHFILQLLHPLVEEGKQLFHYTSTQK